MIKKSEQAGQPDRREQRCASRGKFSGGGRLPLALGRYGSNMKAATIACLLTLSPAVYGQESWVQNTSLPKIVLRPHAPISNAQAFKRSNYSQVYTYSADSIPPSDPYDSDAQAEAAARAFLTTHFGNLPTELKATRILRSATGEARLKNATDKGHTITFRVFWHGIEIHECFAVIYLKGKIVSEANISLGKPEILPESIKPIIPRTTAIENWRLQVVKHFGAPENISPQIANLVFVWSGIDNSNRDEEKHGTVLSPNWAIRVFDRGEELLVDAYSGKVWRND